MKTWSLLGVSAALLLFGASQASADITNIWYADDGDGGLVCPTYPPTSGDSLDIYGDQYWGPGHVLVNIATDTAEDPTLTLNNVIDNDTGFDWTGYIVNVYLNKSFTFSGISVANPSGWTGAVTISPAFNGMSGLWEGQITYTGGTPVNTIIGDPNNNLDFTYKVTFSGATQYTLTEEVTPVPEPGAVLLTLVGLAVFCGISRFRRE